jgi:glycosyltransferase 2 family protein
MREQTIGDRHKSGSLRGPLLVLVAVVVAFASVLLLRNLAQFDFRAGLSSLLSIAPLQIASILIFAAGSYVCLTGFDWLALHYVGRPLPYRRAALASFTALSLGHNIGFAAMSSGAIRYRFYSRWGLTTPEVAKLIVFCGITVGLGLVTLGGLAFLMMPDLSGQVTGIDPTYAWCLGGICLAIPAAYIVLAATRSEPVKIRRWSLKMPTPRLAAAQIVLGTINFALVAGCLHQSLNAFAVVAYPAVATVYVLANSAAIASHVPGGLGVIEASVLLLLPGHSSLAAVLLFRLAYFIVPLVFGLVAFLLSEILLTKTDETETKLGTR